MEKKGEVYFQMSLSQKLFSLRCNLFSFEQRAKPMHAAAVEGAQNQLIQQQTKKNQRSLFCIDGTMAGF